MRFFNSMKALLALAVIGMSVSLVAVDHAEARRGGSFGSRGARTYSAPSPTTTAPRTTSPVNRSMTPQQQGTPASQAARGTQGAQQGRRGMFGGLAGGLLGGLMLGGLIGMLMGNGLGGMAGFLGLILQVGIAILVVSLIMRWFRSRQQPSYAGANGPQRYDEPPQPQNDMRYSANESASAGGGASYGAGSGLGGSSGLGGGAAMPPSGGGDEIGLTEQDYDAFEQLLTEVQAAFTREDYAGLRDRCTPEIVSFLSEELSQNAVNGLRNEVLDVKLLEGDLSEAWREGNDEYATVAMRYESIDIMRDRESGEIREGESHPTETVELWTFVRPMGGSWKLSAIQEA
ncbi:hypothetical protein DLJ53_15615 [Acuticoccus sediminis]|uniref:Tim44-like domain-containing protein n=1 Tax=Acuticoccus sediminis TaxID=2184697 RepID=A0A8B2NY17_9HYPH|nr:TIM44-like domain-containing protein [Acuticoccus sediminis]RAI00678.1 hypothetical protein DLJ53_15615 [Acuticoccus sediminis]